MPVLPSAFSQGLVFIHKQSSVEREAIGAVLGWASLKALPIDSFAEMLAQHDGNKPACLITDLPVHQKIPTPRCFEGISYEEWETPVEPGEASEDSHTLVLCAACLSETGCTFHNGSFCFLRRPYTRGQLLEAIVQALTCDLTHQEQSQSQNQLKQRIGTLTERERQVMDLIYEGLPNKTIAGRMNLSTRTVEAARSSVYRKLNVDSGITLVRLLARMEYQIPPHRETNQETAP